MRITRACDYAFRAMVFLGNRNGNGGAVETAKVAEEIEVPPVYLRKIFQSLSRSGLVRTTAGSGGGVALAMKPEDVTLKAIIESVEGPIVLSDCTNQPALCTRSAKCKVTRQLGQIQQRIQQEFASRTLADILGNGVS
jgi:Rrf2 family transcriptional regulator, iron-sulfur cluster assembly transcription factor